MRYRSKTLAAWLTLALGALGLHRLYLYGRRDRLFWAYPLPTLLGLVGVQRLRALGQDDRHAVVKPKVTDNMNLQHGVIRHVTEASAFL